MNSSFLAEITEDEEINQNSNYKKNSNLTQIK